MRYIWIDNHPVVLLMAPNFGFDALGWLLPTTRSQ